VLRVLFVKRWQPFLSVNKFSRTLSCGWKMSEIITSTKEIPDAPFYVTCTDEFMSGWGHAKGLINRLILPCESHGEACIVEANARGRTDQKNVRICTKKPRLRSSGYLYQVMDRDKAKPWYTKRTWEAPADQYSPLWKSFDCRCRK